MIIYFIPIILVICFYSLICNIKMKNIDMETNNIKIIINCFIIIVMFIYSAFRKNDPDYMLYRDIYNGLILYPSYGFEVIIKISHVLNFGYDEFLFCVCTINMYLLIRFFKYKNKDYDIALLLYFSFFFFLKNMIQYRNLLSILLMYNGLIELDENKKFKSILFAIFGILIHPSTSIILVIYLLYVSYKFFKKYVRVKLVIMISVSIILGIFKYFNDILDKIILLNIPVISNKINEYLYLSETYSMVPHIFGFRDLKFLILCVLLLFLYDTNFNKYLTILYYSFFIGIFIKYTLLFNEALSDRLSENFLILEPLLLALLFERENKKKIIVFFLYVILLIYNICQTFVKNKSMLEMFYL